MAEYIDYLLSAFITPSRNLYWGNFLIGFNVAVVLFFLYYKKAFPIKIKLKRLAHYVFPKRIFLHPSSVIDYQYFFVVKSILFVSMPYVAASIGFVTIELYSIADQMLSLQLLSSFNDTVKIGLYALLTLLCIDFGLFFAHWLMHKVPLFWEFHKVHHSAQVLNPLTVVRMHPMDFFLNSVVLAVIITLKEVIWLGLGGESYPPVQLLSVNAISLFLYGGDGLLRHSHVWLSYGHIIEKYLLSPAQHQIHHSCEVRHIDKNMGMKLAIWDRMFGTLYTTSSRETFRMGLVEHEDQAFRSVAACLLLPFKNLVNKWFSRNSKKDQFS